MILSCILKNHLGNPLHISLALCVVSDNAGPEGSVAEWCYDGFWLEIVGAGDLQMQTWAMYFSFSFVSYKWKCCSTSWTFFFFSAPSKLQLPGLLPCFTLVYSFQDYSRVALILLCNGRVANLAWSVSGWCLSVRLYHYDFLKTGMVKYFFKLG